MYKLVAVHKGKLEGCLTQDLETITDVVNYIGEMIFEAVKWPDKTGQVRITVTDTVKLQEVLWVQI